MAGGLIRQYHSDAADASADNRAGQSTIGDQVSGMDLLLHKPDPRDQACVPTWSRSARSLDISSGQAHWPVAPSVSFA